MFSSEFCKICKNNFLHKTPQVAVSIFENDSLAPVNPRLAVGGEVGPGTYMSKTNSATKNYKSELFCERFLFQDFA